MREICTSGSTRGQRLARWPTLQMGFRPISMGPSLPPCGIDGLTDQVCGICSCPWTEFLEPAGVHLSDVEVSFLVRTHAMYTPQRARKIGDGSPGVNETAV